MITGQKLVARYTVVIHRTVTTQGGTHGTIYSRIEDWTPSARLYIRRFSDIHSTHAMTDEGLRDRAPFRKWAVDAIAAPKSFDATCMSEIPPDRREFAWLQHRRHSPYGLLIPTDWAMDIIHYRYDGEQQYVRALRRLGHELPEVPLDGLSLR
jgi:hypothetical protein